MDVANISINCTGELENEHLLLRVSKDCEISDYVVIDSTYRKRDKVIKKPSHEFYLPPVFLRQGAYLSIWTRAGKLRESAPGESLSQLNLFWGLNEAIWHVDGHLPMVCLATHLRHLAA